MYNQGQQLITKRGMHMLVKVSDYLKIHWATIGLTIVSVIAYIFVAHYVGMFDGQEAAYGSIGASFQVPLNHDYLSWFTAQFVHMSWGHLLGNMLLLLTFGAIFESLLSPLVLAYYFVIVNVSAIAISSYIYPNFALAGSSGAIQSIIVVVVMILLVDKFKWHSFEINNSVFWFIVVVGLILIIFGNLHTGGNVAVWTHVIGIIIGVLFGGFVILQNND